MHLQDGLETAASWGLTLAQAVPGGEPVDARPLTPDDAAPRALVVRTWLPISQFINAMARSLGAHDSYPFVVPDPVIDKLAFIHQVIGSGARGDTPMNFRARRAKAGPAAPTKAARHDPH
jgi:hypothetical protein